MTVSTRPDHGGRSAGVVGVPVRQHEQVEPVDPEQGEAAIERCRFGAGVDERRRVRGPDEDRVALSDVARRDVPGARPRRADHRRRSEPGADRHGEADRETAEAIARATATSPAASGPGRSPAPCSRRAAAPLRHPASHGSRPPGSPAAPCATSAIHDAGSQATWRKRHADRRAAPAGRGIRGVPTTVAIGAAGAASRLAGTP